MHRYFKHFEDVHVTFCTQKFLTNYCNFDFDILDISLQYRLNVMKGHGWGGGKGQGLAWGTGASSVSYRRTFLVFFLLNSALK